MIVVCVTMVRKKTELMTIGQLAQRAGVTTATLRFYESRGLVHSTRTSGNQRRYRRGELRRVAFIRTAQNVGLSLAEITDALATLPDGRIPNKTDWANLSSQWHDRLTERIHELEQLRDELTNCIGCGCMSLSSCALNNTDDMLGRNGPGPRILLGD